MIILVKDFCKKVAGDIAGFMEQIRDDTSRRMTDNEVREVSESYNQVSKMLAKAMNRNPRMADVSIIASGQRPSPFPRDGQLAQGNPVGQADMMMEYQLPGASAWCDLVLLGKGQGKNRVVILELKNFRANSTVAPSSFPGLICQNGNEEKQHPSEQVKGYTEYCQFFHSAVVKSGAVVKGCVYVTSALNVGPYRQFPNDALTERYPIFNTDQIDNLVDFVTSQIEEPDNGFAVDFSRGYYHQNRNILRQVGESMAGLRYGAQAPLYATIQDQPAGYLSGQPARESPTPPPPSVKPFVLLQEQQEGFLRCQQALERALASGKKEVVIIKGPPGSGKSAIAINLWIEAARKYPRGNVVYVTTGASQNANWEGIFKRHAGVQGGEGFLYKSTKFNPGLSGANKDELLKPLTDQHPEFMFQKQNGDFTQRYDRFREYLQFLDESGNLSHDYFADHHYLSVVDEAHALINPLLKNYSANNMAGWCLQAGPQAWHIINESRVAVFLTDTKQSFRDNETTSIEDIKQWAQEFNVQPIEIDLSGLQFRCAGSLDYVDWVNNLISYHPIANHGKWAKRFEFVMVDCPSDVEDYLRQKAAEDSHTQVRLLSSYSRKWDSKGKVGLMHDDPRRVYDFKLPDRNGKEFQKYWNVDHAAYIQAPRNSMMSQDPLSEIGCPYTVRGFDFEYVGILWLNDIVRRDGRWIINHGWALEKGLQSKRTAAFDEQKAINAQRPRGQRLPVAQLEAMPVMNDGTTPATDLFFEKIAQAYRILFTRGIRGVCLYVEDAETREYVKNLL